MEIGVKEVANLLNVSEKTVYRWIKDKKMPGFRVGEQYRFNRAELLEWATSNRINVSVELFSDPADKLVSAASLADALMSGGIHYRVAGLDKASVLGSAIQLMPLPEEVDKSFLLHVLMARESMGSTGIGEGVAIPHVRNPIVMHIPKPMITLCFLEHPIDFDAIDGKPVHTIFTIVSPVISAHLNLLSRLAFALRHPAFSNAIRQQTTRDDIYNGAREVDLAVTLKNELSGGVKDI